VRADVTQGYIVSDLERLRELRRIESFDRVILMRACGISAASYLSKRLRSG